MLEPGHYETDADYELLGMGGGYILRVHQESKCSGSRYPCAIHRPSEHALNKAPFNWRGDCGLMERLCAHGIGHPDPDDLEYKRRTMGAEYNRYAFGVHGCDGCCR